VWAHNEAHNYQRENETKAVNDYQYDHQATPDAHNHEKQSHLPICHRVCSTMNSIFQFQLSGHGLIAGWRKAHLFTNREHN